VSGTRHVRPRSRFFWHLLSLRCRFLRGGARLLEKTEVALLGVLALASACRLNWITAIQIPLSFIVLGAVFALTVIAPQYRQSFPLRLA
jgi:hypothetical protein